MAAFFQAVLDGLYYARQYVVAFLGYLTLRVYGKEIAFGDVKAGTFASRKPSPLSLENAKDIDMLLEMSKESVENAEKRRGVVAEKCKTLLTLGSLLLGVIGVLLPKYLAFDSILMRWLSVVAIAILFNAIIILLMFFDIGQDMAVSLEQDDISLDGDNLKKSLINRHLKCSAATENRTDYLVELFRAARFCFLSALSIVAGLVLCSLVMDSPGDQAERIVREIRSDQSLVNLLRGPKGDQGVRGEQGVDAKPDDILTRLLADDRLKVAIEKAVSQHASSTGKP